MKKQKIFLIAGSTGGHALPTFSLVQKLRNNFDVKVFVSGSNIEKEIYKNISTTRIISGRFNRHNKLKMIGNVLLIIFGSIQSFFYLLFNRPKLIISKGGFLAVPILTSASILRIPFFSHDSDIEIGVANKMFMNQAKKFFVSFPPELFEDKLPKNTIYSGQIISEEFINAKKTHPADRIFITGGGQGAHKINEIIFNLLPELLKKYRITHQVGSKDYDQAKQISSKLETEKTKKYCFYDFSVEKSQKALIDSGLVISRAGMNTIGELSALHRASILIPYPYAAADHQAKNAKYIEKHNGAIVIKEENLSGKSLAERIDYLMSDKKNLETLGNNLSETIEYKGADIIYDEIIKYMREKE